MGPPARGCAGRKKGEGGACGVTSRGRAGREMAMGGKLVEPPLGALQGEKGGGGGAQGSKLPPASAVKARQSEADNSHWERCKAVQKEEIGGGFCGKL